MSVKYCEALLQALAKYNDNQKENETLSSKSILEKVIEENSIKSSMPLEKLTKFYLKREFYLRESFFRQAHNIFSKHFDLSFFEHYTFIIIKPDAIEANAIEKIISCMKNNGFEPIHFREFKFNRHMISALWQYEINCWPIKRVEALSVLLTHAKSLFVILKKSEKTDVFACDFLCKIKGPSSQEMRKPNQIRYEIGAKTGMLDFLHFPDEPIDLLREIGIIFNPNEIKSIINEIKNTNKSLEISNLLTTRFTKDSSSLIEPEKAIDNISLFLQKYTSLSTTEIQTLLENKKWNKIKKIIEQTLKENPKAKKDWNQWNLIVFINECKEPNYINSQPMYAGNFFIKC